MDKYEYRVKTEKMISHMEEKSYGKAMEIADTIDWRRVRNVSMLYSVSKIYEKCNQFEKSRNTLFLAYDRAPDSKKIICRLGQLALKMGDVNEAMDCYDELLVVAPKDPNQYILRYSILKAEGASVEQQIEALSKYKKIEYVERWAYELADMYYMAAMYEECVTECNDLILWFGEGDYVERARTLKAKAEKSINGVDYTSYKEVPQYTPVTPLENDSVDATESELTIIAPDFNALGETIKIDEQELHAIRKATDETSIDNLEKTAMIDTSSVVEALDNEIQEVQDLEEDNLAKQQEEQAIESMTVEELEASMDLEESDMSSVIPTSDEVRSPGITGQIRIDEILAGWEEKQKEMEEAIAREKAKIINEESVVEAELEETNMALDVSKQEESEEEQVLDDEIRQLMEDIENGVEPESTYIENKGSYINDMVVELDDEEDVFDDDVPELDLEQSVEEIEQDELDELDLDLDESQPEEVLEEIDIQLDELEETEAEPEESTDVNDNAIYETDEEFIAEAMSDDENTEDFGFNDTTEYEDEEFSVDFNMDEPMNLNDEEFGTLLEEHKAPSRIEVAKAVATGKTAKIPVSEIAKAIAAGGTIGTDTGFIVQAKYDLEAQSEVGLRAGLSEEQKKLFSYFVPVRGMSEQLVDVLERDKYCTSRGGTSKTGNLLIIGRKGSGKTVLAVDIVKAIQKNRDIEQGKVAIVTGEAMNKKKISDVTSKLYGGALIIEKANQMNEKTVTRLNKAMERDTGELLIVLEDERKPLDILLSSNIEFRRKFTSRLEVPVFINDELVTFGQTYARENECKIDEMGILALYSRIDAMQREDHPVTVAEVKDILDRAMDKAKKHGVKRLAKKMFHKPEDEGRRFILTEKHFR